MLYENGRERNFRKKLLLWIQYGFLLVTHKTRVYDDKNTFLKDFLKLTSTFFFSYAATGIYFEALFLSTKHRNTIFNVKKCLFKNRIRTKVQTYFHKRDFYLSEFNRHSFHSISFKHFFKEFEHSLSEQNVYRACKIVTFLTLKCDTHFNIDHLKNW